MANLLRRSNPGRTTRVPRLAAPPAPSRRSLVVRGENVYLCAMAIREIREVPAPRLKTVSAPVETFDDGLKALVADMFETMYDANGIGLAAIQVGEPLRLVVIDLQEPDPDAEPEGCSSHHRHAQR